MFKMFAMMCLLTNGVSDCTLYNDSEQQVFPDQITCEQAASDRFYEMMDGFIRYNIPFEVIEIGCVESED